MKRIFTLLITCIACSHLSYAQVVSPVEINRFIRQANANLKSEGLLLENILPTDQVNNPIVTMDSSHIWFWYIAPKKWGLTHRILYSQYDNNNNLINRLWINFKDSSWVNSENVDYTYNNKNNLIQVILKNWVNNEWRNGLQLIYEYNSNNNKTSQLFRFWDGTNWEDNRQFFFIYDNSNNIIINLIRLKNSNGWEDSYKDSCTYNSSNKILKFVAQNWDGTKWEYSTQSHYTYANNTDLTSVLSQNWDGTGWVNATKTEYDYDNNKNNTYRLIQYWNNSAWVNNLEVINTYDADKNQTSQVLHQWVNSESKWVNRDSTYYYFHTKPSGVHDVFGTEQKFEVYPNPFVTSITVSTATEQKNSAIKIVDVLGKEIKSIANFTGNQLVIDTEGMNPGIYFIQLLSENSILTSQKIVLQQ